MAFLFAFLFATVGVIGCGLLILRYFGEDS